MSDFGRVHPLRFALPWIGGDEAYARLAVGRPVRLKTYTIPSQTVSPPNVSLIGRDWKTVAVQPCCASTAHLIGRDFFHL